MMKGQEAIKWRGKIKECEFIKSERGRMKKSLLLDVALAQVKVGSG
jgi:hypothetical protein